LNFAEELERQDQQFYAAVVDNPACVAYTQLFSELEADAARNIKAVAAHRRENVTEMILERCRISHGCRFAKPARSGRDERCRGTGDRTRLEARADRYYAEASKRSRP